MEGKENQAYQPDGELHNFQGDVSNEPKPTIDQSEEEPYQHLHQRKIDKEKQPNNNESFTIQEDVPSSITKKVARKGDIFSRAVGAFWASLGRFYKRHKKLLERLTLVLLNVCLLVYFAVAISHHVKQGNEDIGWCNGLGILIILLFFLYMWMFYYLIVKKYFGRILYEHIVAPIVRVWDKAWERTLFRVAISLLVLAALVVFLVLDTVGSRERLVSFFGLIVILLFGFIFSRHPTQILWRPVLWGLGIQFIFGVLTIRWVVGRQIFQCIGDHVSTFLLYTNSGSTFAYGEFLVTNQGVFAFQVMPVIFFFCFCVQILFYYGIIQNIVVKLGWLLQISLGTTVAESVNASASVFLGMSEAPLLIQGYLKDLTKSEVHAIMAGGFATVAGTVLAAYISFGAQADHLITASIMSAPAALCFSKLFYPETEDSKNTVDQIVIIKDESTGVLDAAVKGVTAGIQIVLGIIANVIAFIAFVAFLNGILTWIGDMVGVPDVTFVNIMGYIFIPLAWVMGVEWEQCEDVAKLVGLKTMVNEFVAYQELGVLKKAGKLSPRSEAIATYALCGFSNPGSLGILIGSLTSLCPSQRPIITEVAFRAFIAGSAVCFMTACIAGILLTEDQYTNIETNTTISP